MAGLTVACVKWGTKYPPRYVTRLRNMVARHLPAPHRFVCLTENPGGLDGIECLPLPDRYEGWWNKLSLFRADLFPAGETVLFFDLDLVIARPIGFLLEEPGAFRICDAFSGTATYNSSVMRWQAGTLAHVHTGFEAHLRETGGQPALHGDQAWIYRCVPGARLWPREKVVSFKLDLAPRVPPGQEVPLTDDAAVIVFHGKPDPEDVLTRPHGRFGRAPFVAEHWR